VSAMDPRSRKDGGFTLVEVLVAMGLFLLLMSMVMLMVTSATRATQDTRQFTNINEQARIAVERLTRELRQAKELGPATLPSSTDHDVALTFGVDFDGSGQVDAVASDPEVLTYRYDADHEKLTLTANNAAGDPETRPILSREVSAFELQFRSSLYKYDGCLPADSAGAPTALPDGVTDWTELDTICGGGNHNGQLDALELNRIDLVLITLSVLEGPHRQTYQTQVSLRNRAQS
jgi:prepilin-type N-terminal cleavage/methylation domain-containing protein